MWCGNCQKDVLVVPSADDAGAVTCTRCRWTVLLEEITPEISGPHFDLRSPRRKRRDPSLDARPPGLADDWELDSLRGRKWRGIDRRYDSQPRTTFAIHAGASEPQSGASKSGRTKSKRRRLGACRSTFFCWTILTIGVAAFACGATLLAWSFVDGRGELWRVGMPLTLAGQVAFLIGLVLQLDGIWQHSRRASRSLGRLHEHIEQLSRPPLAVPALTEPKPAQRFYQHLSEGADPRLLVTDLKGQLDLLETKLNEAYR